MKKIISLTILMLPLLIKQSFGQSYSMSYNNDLYYTLSASGTTTLSTSYLNNSYNLSLGFNFTFFDKTFSSVTVKSNGVLYFGSGAAFIDMIGAILQDKPSLGSTIKYLKGGTAGDHFIIIEWYETGFYNDKTNNSYTSFQICLYEKNGAFSVQYGSSSTLYTNYFTYSAPVFEVQNDNTSKQYYINNKAQLVTSYAAMGVPNDGDIFNFTLTPGKPGLSIRWPGNLEILKPSTTYTISWTSSYVNSANVDVSYDGGKTYSNIVKNTGSSSTSYATPALTQDNTNCYIRVYDPANTKIRDSVKFSIIVPKAYVKLFYPAGGESFTVGNKATVKWRYYLGGATKLYYATTKAKSWKLIQTSASGDSTYSWTIPNDTGTYCSFKVVSSTDTSLHDETKGYFKIQPKPIPKSISFYPSEKLGTNLLPRLFENDTFNINWQSTGIGYVNIYLVVNFTQNTIIEGLKNTGTYHWNIPNYNKDLSQVKLIVEDASGQPAIQSLPFDIVKTKPTLQLVTPNGGEYLNIGSTAHIKWNSQGVSNMDIWITYDGWQNATKLAANYNAYLQDFTFVVPNISSSYCAVDLIDLDNILKVQSYSANFFQIGKAQNNGISDQDEETFFSIYPNPSNGTFHLNFGTGGFTGDIVILNNVGQTVWSQKNAHAAKNESLEVNAGTQLSAGIYYVKLISANKEYTRELMIR